MQHIIVITTVTVVFIAVSTVRSGTTVAAVFPVTTIVWRSITIVIVTTIEFVFGSFWRFSYNHFSDVISIVDKQHRTRVSGVSRRRLIIIVVVDHHGR